MTIREFWRDVKDRFLEGNRHPDDRWMSDRGRYFGREDDDWRNDRNDTLRRWPRDEGYDEYRRGFGAGPGIGGTEISSGFFELMEPDTAGFTSIEGDRGHGPYRGRGPAGYRRADDRIREDVCEALTEDEDLDASDIEVTVLNGEVTLTGTVTSRLDKRYAEDLSANVSGVRDVNNQLRTELQ